MSVSTVPRTGDAFEERSPPDRDRQYVAVPTGLGLFRAMTATLSPEIYQPNGGNALYVFELG